MCPTTATSEAVQASARPAGLHRVADWPERLALLVQQRLRQPFAWGVADCCLWAADAVQAITGHDFAAGVRGSYDTALGAARALAGRSPAELARDALGQPLAHPTLAQRGDVVCHEREGQQTLGICVGEQWCAPGDGGLVFQPMSTVICAWRV